MIFYFLPVFTSISSLLIVVLVRVTDAIEREPLKPSVASFLFGSSAYLIAFQTATWFGSLIKLDYSNVISHSGFIFLAQTIIIFIIHIITCGSFYLLFSKQFQTLPDYIVYFLTIGIGYNSSEAFATSLFTINPDLAIPANSHFSPFLYGQAIPLLFTLYGVALFVLNNKSRLSALNPVLIASSLIILALIISITYSVAIYVLNFSPEHIITPYKSISTGLMILVQNISLLASVALISTGVAYDIYIVQIFVQSLENIEYKTMKDLQNPIYYIMAPYLVVWKLLNFNLKTNLPRTAFAQIARYALISWANPSLHSNLLNEANNLIGGAN